MITSTPSSKAYELSTLTGTQVLLLVASETGHVYTFATPKLQPLITKPEGKNLIQSCLNAPDSAAPQPPPSQQSVPVQRGPHGSSAYPEQMMGYPGGPDQAPPPPQHGFDEDKKDSKDFGAMGIDPQAYQGYGQGPMMPGGAMRSPPGMYNPPSAQRQPYPSMPGPGPAGYPFHQGPPGAYGSSQPNGSYPPSQSFPGWSAPSSGGGGGPGGGPKMPGGAGQLGPR